MNLSIQEAWTGVILFALFLCTVESYWILVDGGLLPIHLVLLAVDGAIAGFALANLHRARQFDIGATPVYSRQKHE